jgi:hypoxanthine phosphoribosyltransferase
MPEGGARFAHNSERQFALLLDFYAVEWMYEPTSFPVAWDREGRASQYFTPDFYLPEDDLYIEITTMSQKLVTKKNAKVRRLRELYPDIQIKILYQRDFLNLVHKYGLEHPPNVTEPVPTRIPGPPQVTRLDSRGTPTE